MFWVNPYSQQNQRARLWPVRTPEPEVEKHGAHGAFDLECRAFEQELSAVRRDLTALKTEFAWRRRGLK